MAYVANADSGTLSVIDTGSTTVQLVAPIADPAQAKLSEPMGLAITPNGGFAYMTYGTASNATVINTSTNLRTASVPVGLNNAAITVHPAGTFVYTIANGFGGIAVIDTVTNRTIAVVAPEIGESTSIAVTPDGTAIYVVSDDLGGVASVSTSDYQIASFTPLDLGLYDALAISPSGNAIYTGTLDGITVVDPVTHQPSGQIAMSEPFAIVFAPDGRTAYASVVDDGKVAVIDTAALRVSALITVAENPGGLALSSDGAQLYVTDITSTANEPGLFIVDTASQQIVRSVATLGDGPTDVELTVPPQGLCVGDARGQTEVIITELVRSVGYSLDGCPGRFPMSVAPPP
jgi:YVTN family beta-propeller protein